MVDLSLIPLICSFSILTILDAFAMNSKGTSSANKNNPLKQRFSVHLASSTKLIHCTAIVQSYGRMHSVHRLHMVSVHRTRGRGGAGGGGFSPPTFLKIIKSYWGRSVFSPPLWVTSHPPPPPPPPPPPTFKVAPRALVHRAVHMCARLAQLVRSLTANQKVPAGFNPRPGRGLNFGRPSFATPSVDRDVKP